MNLLWFLSDDRTPLLDLTSEQVDVVLKNLIHLSEVETRGERVLSLLARKHPGKVFDFFLERLAYAEAKEDDERYKAVPYAFRRLQKLFVDVADMRLKVCVAGSSRATVCSSLAPAACWRADKFLTYLHSGNRDDVEFMVRTLSAYRGQTFLNEACREAVRALPPDDDLLSIVEIVLESTDVLSGEFGRVEAYARKKQEMSGWLTDPDAHVRAFAEKRLLTIDRQMAAEQRRSEEDLEMRKRMYDQPPGEEGDAEA